MMYESRFFVLSFLKSPRNQFAEAIPDKSLNRYLNWSKQRSNAFMTQDVVEKEKLFFIQRVHNETFKLMLSTMLGRTIYKSIK